MMVGTVGLGLHAIAVNRALTNGVNCGLCPHVLYGASREPA